MESPDQGTDHVTSPSKDCKLQRERSHSPEPSCVSMKSDDSMRIPVNFRNKISSPVHSNRKRVRSQSPEPSCVSMKTEISSSVHSKLQRERSHSPEPSCVSMKSDGSMQPPLRFRNGTSSTVHR